MVMQFDFHSSDDQFTLTHMQLKASHIRTDNSSESKT